MTVHVNGRLIKELRIKHSYSQEELADIVGVNLRRLHRSSLANRVTTRMDRACARSNLALGGVRAWHARNEVQPAPAAFLRDWRLLMPRP